MPSVGAVPNYAVGGPISGRRIPVQNLQFEKMVERGVKAGVTAKEAAEREVKTKAQVEREAWEKDRENDPLRSGKKGLWRAYAAPTKPPGEKSLGITMGDDPPYARGPGPQRPELPYNNPGLVHSPTARRQWARIERLDPKGPFAMAPQGTAIEAHPSDRARNRQPGQMTLLPDAPGEKVWKPNEAKALMAAEQKATKARAVKAWTGRPSYRAEDQGQGALMQPKEYE